MNMALQVSGLRALAAGVHAPISTATAPGRTMASGLSDRDLRRRRFLIIDPQAMMRHGLALSLQSGHPNASADQAASVEEALCMADRLGHLDLIVLDVDGLRGAVETSVRRLGAAFRSVPMIVTCSTADAAVARACLQAGANAFLLKSEPGAVLEHTVALILSGEGLMPVPTWLLKSSRPTARPAVSPAPSAALGRLTGRQREIFSLLLTGCSNKEIARRLGVLEGTVKVHVRAMMQKLGATNRTQVAVMAARSGLRPEA